MDTRKPMDIRSESSGRHLALKGKNPFEDPKELIDRAHQHISDVEAHIRAFFDGKPFALEVEPDGDTGYEVHKVRLTDQLPLRAAGIAKDVFSNLRDALDHAVYASAVVVCGNAPTKTGFPFAEDAAAVHKKLNTKLTDVPPEIRTFLEQLCPHSNGNQLLWGLNRTRNIETHRVLVPLIAVSLGNSLRLRGETKGGHVSSVWDAAGQEVEFLRVRIGSGVQYEHSITSDVVFADVDVLGGEPAITTLYALADEVAAIVVGVEAEVGRLIR